MHDSRDHAGAMRVVHFVAWAVVGQAPEPSDGEDLASGVGREIKVGLDRWSVGQVGLVDLLIATAVVGVGVLLAWLARTVARRVGRRTSGAAHATFAVIGILMGSVCVLFAISIALEILGFGLGPILVLILIVVVGLLLLRPMMTNLSSGLLLQIRGALEAGDLVRTNGILGIVEEINTRSVVIDTSDGRRVHVPNTEVLDGTIENYTSLGRRRSTVEFLVEATLDVDEVATTVCARLGDVDHILSEPCPQVLIDRVVGALVVLRCDVWHDPPKASARLAEHDTITTVLDVLEELDVMLGGQSIVVLGDGGSRPADDRSER